MIRARVVRVTMLILTAIVLLWIVLISIAGTTNLRTKAVILNSWYDTQFARKMYKLEGKSDLEADIAVRDFEDRLATSFASDLSCKGISLIRYNLKEGSKETASARSGQHWWLALSIRPAVQKQQWDMVELIGEREFKRTTGEGTPNEIVRTICRVVSGKGGSLTEYHSEREPGK